MGVAVGTAVAATGAGVPTARRSLLRNDQCASEDDTLLRHIEESRVWYAFGGAATGGVAYN